MRIKTIKIASCKPISRNRSDQGNQIILESEISELIKKIRANKKDLRLTDTRFYYFFSSIFKEIIASADDCELPMTFCHKYVDNHVADFNNWLHTALNASPARAGLLWVTVELQYKEFTREKLYDFDDYRLNNFLNVFAKMGCYYDETQATDHFAELIEFGWDESPEAFKKATYSVFIATVATQARSELFSFSRSLGISDAQTKDDIKSLVQQREDDRISSFADQRTFMYPMGYFLAHGYFLKNS